MKKQPFTSLIIIVFIIGFVCLKIYLDKHKTRGGVLEFKGCRVEFAYKNIDIDNKGFNHSLDFLKAKRILAGCLCEKYLHQRDTAIASMILKFSRTCQTAWFDEHPEHNKNGSSEANLDSILKYRKQIFDPKGH